MSNEIVSEKNAVSRNEDVFLTDEVAKLLKGYMGFEENDSFPYVPKAFRIKDSEGNYRVPKKFWPVFTLIGKDGIEAATIQDTSGYVSIDKNTDERKIVLQGGRQRLETLKTCCRGWKNWFEADWKTIIPFDVKKDLIGGKLSDAKLKKFPVPLQEELQEAINERDTLTKEEMQGLDF